MRNNFAVFGAVFAGLAYASSPPVKVSLRSSWTAPPPLLEIIETVALENPDAFFPFLDRVTDPEALLNPQKLTPEALHQYALQTAVNHGFLSEPGSLAAVDLDLALHAATPKIEAFYQHYLSHAKTNRADGCGSWVDWYGTIACDVETLAHLAGVETLDPSDKASTSVSYTRPKLLTFDHIYPSPALTLERPLRTAILYASLDSSNFRELHSYLFSLANRPAPHVEYVLRHIPDVEADPSSRTYLSGYSVALDLKKMDYLAVDDRYFSQQSDKNDVANDDEAVPLVDPILSLLEKHPENPNVPDPSAPLDAEEILDIGYKASQVIAESSEPLGALKQLSHNFPKYANTVARRVVVNESISEELHGNQLLVQGGINAFWINGVTLPEQDVNPFALLRLLRKERSIMLSLTSLGLSRGEAMDLLTHPIIAIAQSDKGAVDGLVDASDRLEDESVIVWWNNIEKDSRYARWTPSLHLLIRPTYPGQFPSVKLNLFNVVLLLDLSQTTSLNFIAGPVNNIIERSFPFRFGVVPLTETKEGTQLARLFYYIVDNHGRRKAMAFIKKISQVHLPPEQQTASVDWKAVTGAYDDVCDDDESEKECELADIDHVLSGGIFTRADSDKVTSYAQRLGAKLSSSPLGHAFVNGKHLKMGETFLRSMQLEIAQQLQLLQEELYKGQLSDDDREAASTYFYDLPTTSHRRNIHIIPESTAGSLRIGNLPEIFSRTKFHVSSGAFVYPSNRDIAPPITLYVVADLDSQDGTSLIREALEFLTEESQTRISFIHNPNTTNFVERTPVSWILSHLIGNNLLSETSPRRLSQALGLQSLATPDDGTQIPPPQEDIIADLTGGVGVKGLDVKAYGDFVKRGVLTLRELQVNPGEHVLLVNGRVVGPLESGDFKAADFRALEEYELRRRVQPVVSALEEVKPDLTASDRAAFSHLVSMASSVISSIQIPDPSEAGLFDAPHRPRQRGYRLLTSDYTTFELGDNSTALYQISALVDPLTEVAQKWASLLEWLSNVPDIFIEVHLNPAKLQEIPLKRFFRYNLSPALSFDDDGLEIPAQTVFEDLPIEPIYTLAMDVPSSWLVRPRVALYDLDNIQLGALSPEDSSVEAVFELDFLVVEGHARDTLTNSPPRGIQLQLVTEDGTAIDDTQVVANLGYFQFKAKPGVFRLEIREGRGRKIFEMESVGNEGWNSPTVKEVGSEITLTSFEGLPLYPRLARKPGRESADVLEETDLDDEEAGSVVENVASWVKSLFGQTETTTDIVLASDAQAEINIFTVASGLLYERFVSIMILSVLRNTQSSVKFWFIENFLSPSFLEFIPHFAEAYGFQYELVTYKWPSWLRAQKEKQRIIWAYKILFLDVLFPMDLKKVIFVDADQIVRADLKELVDLNLHGAPYGYTPMGDDNYDMEGFRFWKTGYWKDFLKGRPYHISALYVVDLVRFRQIAAGDILRGQYQQLSADPNSLANLDQDLPNNLQREVPIYSLHEDWLWCETWCSKDRLDRAKTIDLCQNPLTKEPKLARARQIPEWEEYDGEISRFARSLADKGLIQSRIATADTNVLAGAPAQEVKAPDSDSDSDAEEPEQKGETPRDEL